MKEDFLHYLWQHQYFDKQNLATADQQAIQVLRCGFYNTNAGPDFLQAQVKVGAETWNGSVEIHVKASDWLRHHHDRDARYDQVVLHVVWEADRSLQRTDGSSIPTLELKERVEPKLLQGYYFFQQTLSAIPCAPLTGRVPALVRLEMLDRVLVERLEQKAARLQQRLQLNHQDWEATTYQALCEGFGFKINAGPFGRLSQVLPYAVLRKHHPDLPQLEALLLGQAGFLQQVPAGDDYLKGLQQEFRYLRHKYRLPKGLQASDWNLLRLRPANFPPVRLAQLAALLQGKDKLFASLLGCQGLQEVMAFFKKPVSPYWQHHYLPGRPAASRLRGMGRQSIVSLVINTLVPLLFAYSHWQDNQAYRDRALAWLEQLPAEQNKVLQAYRQLGLPVDSAADSQAYLQLFHHYCQSRKCLSCSLGHHLLKSHLRT
ncbi:MAG: DUF2851 family protein [Adhaeribacter sp.]